MCISPITIQGKKLPCGRCAECVRKYQSGWALRMAEEAKDWQHTYMITLTYDDAHITRVPVYPYMASYLIDDSDMESTRYYRNESEYEADRNSGLMFTTPLISVKDECARYLKNLPINRSHSTDYDSEEMQSKKYLNPVWYENEIRWVPTHNKKAFVDFVKLLRQKVERKTHTKLKYFACSEYGEETLRPHFHLILYSNVTIDIIQPAVQKYWTQGEIVDVHELKEVYKGKHVDLTAAFMYASKYVAKPDFIQNPYEKLGLVSPCFRMISKGIGSTYRKDLRNIIDKKFADKFASVQRWDDILCSHDPDINIGYNHIRVTKSNGDEKMYRLPENNDLAFLYDKEITKINGLNFSLLDEFSQHMHYLYMGDKVYKYSAPRYWTDSIKPKIKVEKEVIKWNDDNSYEIEIKILTRVDSDSVWYKAYQAYVQYRNIQSIYQLLLQRGEVDENTTRSETICKIRYAMAYVDDERFKEAVAKAYKPYCGFSRRPR